MHEPIAFFNGQFIAASAASIPLNDAGFVLGATVTEQLRTFGGRLFRLDEHLARLARSLEIVGVDPLTSAAEFRSAAIQVAEQNHALLEDGNDLGLAMIVTPGLYAPYAEGKQGDPLVCIYSYRLPFVRWAETYRTGCRLVTTPVQQVPAECWPPDLKCRSRMHYYLADRAAAAIDPQARALLLNRRGELTETSTANVLLVEPGPTLVAAPPGEVLAGISQQFVMELADRCRLPTRFRPISLDEALQAEEILLTSTPYGIAAAVRLNGAPIGEGRPGPVFRQLLSLWSTEVGFDISEQAHRFAGDSSAR